MLLPQNDTGLSRLSVRQMRQGSYHWEIPRDRRCVVGERQRLSPPCSLYTRLSGASPYTGYRSAVLQTSWHTDSIHFSSRVPGPCSQQNSQHGSSWRDFIWLISAINKTC